jgi:aminoglycoside phosphotransferase
VTDPAVKRARGGGNGTVFEITLGAADALLMTAVRGAHLVARSKCQPPESIVEMLAAALRACHSVNASDCPIEAYVPSESIVRGDACLPNIVVGEDGSNGYVDLADLGAGDVEVDLSAGIWSLPYNLGPGFGRRFVATTPFALR